MRCLTGFSTLKCMQQKPSHPQLLRYRCVDPNHCYTDNISINMFSARASWIEHAACSQSPIPPRPTKLSLAIPTITTVHPRKWPCQLGVVSLSPPFCTAHSITQQPVAMAAEKSCTAGGRSTIWHPLCNLFYIVVSCGQDLFGGEFDRGLLLHSMVRCTTGRHKSEELNIHTLRTKPCVTWHVGSECCANVTNHISGSQAHQSVRKGTAHARHCTPQQASSPHHCSGSPLSPPMHISISTITPLHFGINSQPLPVCA